MPARMYELPTSEKLDFYKTDKNSFIHVPNAIIVTCHNGEIRSILYPKEENNGEN